MDVSFTAPPLLIFAVWGGFIPINDFAAMNLSYDRQWFAIQARSGAEAAVETRLRTMSIETMLPLARRTSRHARTIIRPFFTGYLFARFSAAESWRAVTYSHGVIRVVGRSDRPLAVDDTIIASIRARMGNDGCVKLHESAPRAGDCVRIAAGPLTGWSGVF
jgi:transcriptional antiterminator RfaH